ncbi:MAG: ChbG/HpnK family deacetylase [Bacteroidaceae bacterium]|nr:ChbG/HpnK family deacetylase [Bacteroidaceae bacterium]
MIILNADDFGHSKKVNEGVVGAFAQNLIQRTSLMMNMPKTEEAVNLAVENLFFDRVGLHLNLTEGAPLTFQMRQLRSMCTDGYFNRENDIYVHENKLTEEERSAVYGEIKMQIERFQSYGFLLTNIDSHHQIHAERQIFDMLKDLAKGFEFMRTAKANAYSGVISLFTRGHKSAIDKEIQKSFKTLPFFDSYDSYVNAVKPPKDAEIRVRAEWHNRIVYDRTNDYDYIPLAEYDITKL